VIVAEEVLQFGHETDAYEYLQSLNFPSATYGISPPQNVKLVPTCSVGGIQSSPTSGLDGLIHMLAILRRLLACFNFKISFFAQDHYPVMKFPNNAYSLQKYANVTEYGRFSTLSRFSCTRVLLILYPQKLTLTSLTNGGRYSSLSDSGHGVFKIF
jgi:hypothetical protein